MSYPSCYLLLTVVLQLAFSQELDLLIYHNNDMHGRFEQTSQSSADCSVGDDNCYGGFARTAHVIREGRNKEKNGTGPKVLYLNAGDTFTGTTWFSVHTWKIAAEFMNILGPDVMSFGNHEFDSGNTGLTPFIDAIKFPIVAANLDFSNNQELLERNIPKSIVLEIQNFKVAIIGYVTPDTIHLSSPENITFKEEVKSIQEECERLSKLNVTIFIALGHSGFSVDKKIARNVPCIDLVIGGHTNTFLWNGPQPDSEQPEGPYPMTIIQKSGKKVPVVQAYAYTKYLGKLHVKFNADGDLIHVHGQPVLLNKDIPQDDDVLQALEKYRVDVLKEYNKIIGKTRVYMDGKCRFKECNLGNFISDCFVEYKLATYKGPFWTDTAIGIIQGGAIRTNINTTLKEGNITRGELLPVMPFNNPLVALSLKGSDLIKTLELGIRSDGETSHGEFLQMSGLRVVYDSSQPAFSRVVNVKVRCADCVIPKFEDINPNKTYKLITTNFLVRGGDGYYILANKSIEKEYLDVIDVDAVSWCIEKNSPVYTGLEGRIQFVSSAFRCSFTINGMILVVVMYGCFIF